MKTRPGVTLLEVLVAIFIMGIGLLALLTLFPLGATTMSAAMRDARCNEAGNNAKSVCLALNLRQDPIAGPAFQGPSGPNQLPTDWNGASYPVFVDPVGLYYVGSTPASIPGTLVQRVGFSQALTGPRAIRWCSLWDDYAFDGSGSTNLATGVARESRFTWAYMLKRPNWQNSAVVEANIVCYAGRNLQIPGGEVAYPATYSNASPRTIIITYAGDKPNLKNGGWILDATAHDINKDTVLAMRYGPVHGTFYRVVGFTEVNTNQIEIELQTVPVAPVNNIVIMDNVAEVFPVGTGRP